MDPSLNSTSVFEAEGYVCCPKRPHLYNRKYGKAYREANQVFLVSQHLCDMQKAEDIANTSSTVCSAQVSRKIRVYIQKCTAF